MYSTSFIASHTPSYFYPSSLRALRYTQEHRAESWTSSAEWEPWTNEARRGLQPRR